MEIQVTANKPVHVENQAVYAVVLGEEVNVTSASKISPEDEVHVVWTKDVVAVSKGHEGKVFLQIHSVPHMPYVSKHRENSRKDENSLSETTPVHVPFKANRKRVKRCFNEAKMDLSVSTLLLELQVAMVSITVEVPAIWVAFTTVQDEVLVQLNVEQSDKLVVMQALENLNEVRDGVAGQLFVPSQIHEEGSSKVPLSVYEQDGEEKIDFVPILAKGINLDAHAKHVETSKKIYVYILVEVNEGDFGENFMEIVQDCVLLVDY